MKKDKRYRIRKITSNEKLRYSSGSSFPAWSASGKTWAMASAVIRSIKVDIARRGDRSIYERDDWEVVEYDLSEASVRSSANVLCEIFEPDRYKRTKGLDLI